jgi:WD40-like Beta Propeller Repeat
MKPTPRLLRRAAALAGLCLTLAPAAASADSIVFIKDSNVWLGKPDGTGLYQVTTDGTYASPYRSPSQADNGIIAVGHGDEILRMKQNGTVLNRLNPYPLTNSVSHPIDGPAVDVAISPDGSKIAYTFVSYECPVGASCGARGATGYTAADHLTPPQSAGTTYFTNPSWVTSTRTLQFGGYGSQVNIHDVGTPAAVHWFDDSDYAAPSEDLGDGEVSRDGTRIALVRSYDANTHLIWWKLAGNAQSGAKPAIGDPLTGCVTGKQAGTDGPTWSPDGNSLAWKETNAGRSEIWVKPQVDDCGVQPRLLFAGGSEPDWGPAAVNPGPRATTGGGPTPSPGPATGGGRPATATAALAVKRVKLGKALKSGLRLTLKGAKPGRRAVVAKRGRKVVARGTAKVGASGTASVTLRFTKVGKRALRRAAKVKLVITGAGARATITLKR